MLVESDKIGQKEFVVHVKLVKMSDGKSQWHFEGTSEQVANGDLMIVVEAPKSHGPQVHQITDLSSSSCICLHNESLIAVWTGHLVIVPQNT